MHLVIGNVQGHAMGVISEVQPQNMHAHNMPIIGDVKYNDH